MSCPKLPSMADLLGWGFWDLVEVLSLRLAGRLGGRRHAKVAMHCHTRGVGRQFNTVVEAG